MNDDIRVMDTPTLTALMEDAEIQGFNRAVDATAIKKLLDPKGSHVAQIMLPFHSAANKNLVPHHRVTVYAKTKKNDDPLEFMLDISANHWSWLFTTEEWVNGRTAKNTPANA